MRPINERLQRPYKIYPIHLQPPIVIEPDRVPELDTEGRMLHKRAIAVPWDYSQEYWQQMNRRMDRVSSIDQTPKL